MLLFFLALIFVSSVKADDDEKKYSALSFGSSNSDYIEFNFDMAPFRNSLSLCSWVKKVYTSSSYPTFFHYYHRSSGAEIWMTSNGADTRVLGDSDLNSYSSSFSHAAGTWYSYCVTWSRSSRTSKLYLDGKLVGTDQTAARELYTGGGKLMFNRLSTSYSSSSRYVFGGQLYQFNMFSEVLSAADIKKIAEGGLCSDMEEYEEIRVLRWEDILARSRSGSVREVAVTCDWKKMFRVSQARLAEVIHQLDRTEAKLEESNEQLNKTEANRKSLSVQLNETKVDLEATKGKLEAAEDKLEATEAELEATEGKLEATEAELEATEGKLEAVSTDLNQTEDTLNSTREELETVRGDLTSTKGLLETKTAEQKKTAEKLDTCSGTLADTRSELEGARKFENITRWDVLYTEPYFHKVFTEELYEQLTSSWDMLRKLVGVNVTDGVVDHFRQYHTESVCDIIDHLSSSWDMLRQFVGVEMTDGLVDHFEDTHTGLECENQTES